MLVLLMVCEFNPDAVTKMVLLRLVPVRGTGTEGIEVMYNILPAEAAKIVVLGDPTEPVGDNALSLKVQPAALDPERIRVPLPLMYCPMLRLGVPDVIRKIFPEMYPPATDVFALPTKPVNVAWFEMVEPVISILEGFVICPWN